MKRLLIFVFMLFIPYLVFCQSGLLNITIKELEYDTINKATAAAYKNFIVDEYNMTGYFNVLKDTIGSEYILVPSIRKAADGFLVQMKMLDSRTQNSITAISRKAESEEDIKRMILVEVQYFVNVFFFADVYFIKNWAYFQPVPEGIRGTNFQASETEYKDTNFSRGPVIEAMTDNFYKLFPLSASLTVATNYSLGLINEPSLNSNLYLQLFADYNLWDINYFFLSAYATTGFFILDKAISSVNTNMLSVITLAAGVGANFSFPFFRQLSFHLYGGGGFAISVLNSIQFTSDSVSGDYLVNTAFEIRYNITDKFALSLNTVYNWIFYINSQLYQLHIGLTAGFRF